MKFSELPSPVIVVGMHSAGTSLLAKIVNMAGVFMIPDMPEHHEDLFFSHEINNKLMLNNQWHVIPLMSEEAMMTKWDRFSSRIENELPQRMIEHGYNGKSAWGFKDPRTCILLPMYLRLWPKAVVLHIKRDVNMIADSMTKIGKPKDVSVEYRKELAELYMARVALYGPQFSGGFHELSYEDLCLHPVKVTKKLVEGLGLTLNDELLSYLQNSVYKKRIGKGGKE